MKVGRSPRIEARVNRWRVEAGYTRFLLYDIRRNQCQVSLDSLGGRMLFLFDIDGTLLRGMPPAHRMALCDAAEQIFGVAAEPTHLGKTAGITDTAIARRMLLQAGVPLDALSRGLPAFFAAAADAYDHHVPDDLRPYLTPHAIASLEWLVGNQAILGLVTGNIKRIAWRKLAAAR